jgi:Tol biopolymer transport system component/DNA-binding winged helix-turn-helix (wHTH) protein
MQTSILYFDQFELDLNSYELRKSGRVIKLEKLPMELLILLAESEGQLVTREQIIQRLWDDNVFVDTRQGINTAVRKLRIALQDDSEHPRLLQTVPGRGYRLLAVVSSPAAAGGQMIEPAVVPPSSSPTDVPKSISLDPLPAAPPQPLSAKKILIGVSLLAILAAGFLGYRSLSARHAVKPPAGTAFSKMRITQLTSMPGRYWDPAFSPDGRQIAYFWDGENRVKGDLYVQLVGGANPLRLTHTSTGFICCADWSPDGQQIVFARCDDHGGSIIIIPALGGSERKLTDVVCWEYRVGFPQWTADGKSLVLVDSCTPAARSGIVIFSLQTGEKRCLDSPPPGDRDFGPVLSPDRKTVAFQRWASVQEIYTVAISGGNLRQLTNERFDNLPLWLMWSPDGKYIVFEPTRDRLARIPASGGPLESTAVYPKIGAMSRDHRRLAFIEPALAWILNRVVWRAKLANAGGRVVAQNRILVSATGGNSSAQLSPDERRLVFAASHNGADNGADQLWRSNADGSDPLQLTFFERGFAGTPRWSPDGKWIAFDYHSPAPSQIFLVDSEGRNLHVLVSDTYPNEVPSWSDDGKAVYFASRRTGDNQVWRHELSTGKETQVTRHGGFAAFESYDAKWLYYSKYEGGGIWKMPVGGGQEDLVTDSLHRGDWGNFAVTNNGLYLVDSDAKVGPAIMFYNFQTRRLSPILTFEKDPCPGGPNLAASRDGRTLFYSQVEFENSTVSMVENFQ